MRVRVEAVIDAARGIVRCATPLGVLSLVWDARPVPASGDHEVELEVPGVLTWGREITGTADGGTPDGPERSLVADTLLGLDGSGVAEIQLREGVLLVETFGEPPLGAVGGAVELRPPRIHAHPYQM